MPPTAVPSAPPAATKTIAAGTTSTDAAGVAQVRNDPPGPAEGIRKVEKGGWWGSNSFVARAAYRHFEDLPS